MTKHIFNMNFSKYLWMLPIMLMLLTIASCDDDDNYTTSRNALLTFSRDSVKMDTVFTSVPSSTYSFWVYNPNEDGGSLNFLAIILYVLNDYFENGIYTNSIYKIVDFSLF